MNFASPIQKFQDWFTQQWVILWGKKLNPKESEWLMGPFGNLNGIGLEFIHQLAQKENLEIRRNDSIGILNSKDDLNLSTKDLSQLSPKIMDFYVNSSLYQLKFKIKWNPLFKPFGMLVNRLFSKRIDQLFLPTDNSNEWQDLSSEIIGLYAQENQALKYKFWIRKIKATQQIIYSGIYTTTEIPSGLKAVKAIFPLPNGNATVIMTPKVTKQGSLMFQSEGSNWGSAGFYFLLKDAKGNNWSQYIRSFRDTLILTYENDQLSAHQNLSLWRINVLKIQYKICLNEMNSSL